MCKTCGEEKEIASFHKKKSSIDGHEHWCKSCRKAWFSEYRQANLIKFRNYMKEFRVKYEEEEKHSAKLRMREYRKSDSAKGKEYARSTINRCIKQGKVIRKPCERCGLIKSEAHHEDYSKPLDVIWLCKQHHADRHREQRRLGHVET